ncbi:MAG: fibronectin type III domain-containing protein [Thermoanaerobaculaceae bacterium]
MIVSSVLTGMLAGAARPAGAQTCAAPACTFTTPPAEGITQTRYDLDAAVVPSNCGFSYWVDCGTGSPPAWGSVRNEICTYPANGNAGGRTYSWAIKVGNASKTTCEKSDSSTVYDCQLTCGPAVVPPVGEVGVPVVFTTTASAAHCKTAPLYSWDVSGFDYCRESSCSFTFNAPGTYTWRLVVMTQWGNNPTSFPSCQKEGTITIGSKDLVVGSIRFKADVITQQGSDYTLSGKVRANDVLHFSDKVTFRGTPSSGRGDLFTDGALSVATSGQPTRITSGKNQYFAVDGTSSTGKLRPQLVPPLTTLDFTLAGVPLYLADRTSTATEIKLVGSAGVSVDPFVYVGKADGLRLAETQLSLGLAGGSPVNLVATRLVNGSGVPGVRLERFLALSYDGRTSPGTLRGTFDVGFPFLTVAGPGGSTALPLDLVIENGCISSLESAATLDAAVRLGAGSRPFLDILAAGILGICDPPSYSTLMTGDLTFGEEGSPNLQIADSAWLYRPPRTFKLLRGSPRFLDRPVLDARGGITSMGPYDVLLLAGTYGTGGLPGGSDVLRGTLTSATMSWRPGPYKDAWTSLGTLEGRFVLSPDCRCAAEDGDQCVAARAGLLALYQGATLTDKAFTMRAWGAKGNWSAYLATFDGANVFTDVSSLNVRIVRVKDSIAPSPSVTCWLGSNLVPRPTSKSTTLLAAPTTAVERTATFGKVEDLAVFGVKGKGTTLPSIYLRTPGGQRLTPATIAQLPGAAYAADAGATLAVFAVKRAAAGTWVIGEDNLPESQVELTVMAPQPPPVTMFSSVQTSGASTAITVTVAPPSTGTTVALYYSRTPGGLPDGEIASGLSAGSGTVTATWDTSAVASGAYYLSAITEDGRNGPVTTTYPTPVTLDVGGLNPPTNLQAVRSGDMVTLTWTPSTTAAVVGYEVRYTDTPDQPGYPQSISAPVPNGMTVNSLGYSRSYRFCVAAYDLDGRFSPCSASVVVGPGKGRARRHLP